MRRKTTPKNPAGRQILICGSTKIETNIHQKPFALLIYAAIRAGKAKQCGKTLQLDEILDGEMRAL